MFLKLFLHFERNLALNNLVYSKQFQTTLILALENCARAAKMDFFPHFSTLCAAAVVEVPYFKCASS